jgi:hypothetical protein
MAMDDDALSRALFMAGIGMIGQQDPWQGLARGGMFGLQGYDQALEMKDRRKLLDAKLQEEALQAQAKQAAMDRQKKMTDIFAGAATPQPGTQRSIVDVPGYQPKAAQPANVGQMLLNAGFVKEAEDYAKAQGAIHGEAYGALQVTKSGQPYYMTKQGPRYVADSSFVPREELHFSDSGDMVGIGQDKFTGAVVSQGIRKNMSPAERDASARGWFGANLDKARFDRGELTDVTTPEGGTRKAYVTPQGANFVPGTGEKLPEVPASIRTAIAQNDVTLSKIGRALQLVDDQPGALGPRNALPFAENVRQYTNEEGTEVRALVADIGSQKLHDRSGANITINEAPRLVPFIPNVRDKPSVVKTKLTNFQREYEQMNQELRSGKSISQVAAPRMENSGVPSLAAIEAERMRRGNR